MGFPEILLAAATAGAAGLGSGVPVAAWGRTRDPRFLLIAGANLALLALGLVWLWAYAAPTPPSYAVASLPEVALGALVAVLLLSASLLPRRR
ncbi:MAG: hypothetical protein L3K04_04585 [Thermoplasmata archaeon]|nr:hypothetical protein [Thermoplasmata archaeon]MCI4337815.1 hypothetical protein [Thermoplasmata archaeon]MCI4341674.1 hypothetical protein [Thermoplasmata archaeon]